MSAVTERASQLVSRVHQDLRSLDLGMHTTQFVSRVNRSQLVSRVNKSQFVNLVNKRVRSRLRRKSHYEEAQLVVEEEEEEDEDEDGVNIEGKMDANDERKMVSEEQEDIQSGNVSIIN
ncbi:hypothetical protein Pmani_038318 [Petrolisthes manimaculis]|uniref:Uncharacterized protein n=1 Tax=Petrolisthes manimaculis TaxID=1843537 RepID=A0AAE1NEY4_9EUCA|nr:hypothetical protein Pmani_038318 [Petrolisthes manimaculis]